MTIIRTTATLEHFHFLKEAYPWLWGSEEKFQWKHLQDPFCKEDVFEYRHDSGELIGLIFARSYPISYRGKSEQYLSFMDFAVKKEYRNNMIGRQLENDAMSEIPTFAAIGTAGKELYEKIYKRNPVLTILHTVELKPRQKTKEFQILTDDETSSERINENPHLFYTKRTKEIMAWIRQNPSYEEVVFVGNQQYTIGIGIKESKAHVIEMSAVTQEAFEWAIQAAANFAEYVVVDLPENMELALKDDMVQKNEVYIVYRPLQPVGESILHDSNIKWIPKVDRR